MAVRTPFSKTRKLPNPLKGMQRAIMAAAMSAARATGQVVVYESKELLKEQHGGSDFYTGELESRIYSTTEKEGKYRVHMRCFADAENPDNGALYAQFLEQGTGDKGAHDENAKKWRYKDRKGNWHTTSGMAATPFLEPPAKAGKEYLMNQLHIEIEDRFDVNWYKGSLQLWNEKESEGDK